MLKLMSLVRRTIEGAVLSILTIVVVSVLGISQTVNALLADRSLASILFLLVLGIVLADLIGKFISIFNSTFPDLIPALGDGDLERASLIQRLRPIQMVGLLSGAHVGRLAMFLVLFGLLGTSYAFAPLQAQATLFGDLGPVVAVEAFLREGFAGSLGYFLFFIGPDDLAAVTRLIIAEPLASSTVNGDVLLVGIRLYGLAFTLSLLRTLVTPIIYLRARRRAASLTVPTPSTA